MRSFSLSLAASYHSLVPMSVGDGPRQLGSYKLVERLASGGMGTVFLGRTRGGFGFSRTVAVKTLHENLVHDEGLVLRFLDEARLAARIQHPNVVPVLIGLSREILDRQPERPDELPTMLHAGESPSVTPVFTQAIPMTPPEPAEPA